MGGFPLLLSTLLRDITVKWSTEGVTFERFDTTFYLPTPPEVLLYIMVRNKSDYFFVATSSNYRTSNYRVAPKRSHAYSQILSFHIKPCPTT